MSSSLPSPCVYFVQCQKTGWIKIGTSKSVVSRVLGLRSGRLPVIVLGLVHGDTTTEREIHRQFRNDRHFGEWFLPSEQLLEFIKDSTIRFDSTLFQPQTRPSQVAIGKEIASFSLPTRLVNELRNRAHRLRVRPHVIAERLLIRGLEAEASDKKLKATASI